MSDENMTNIENDDTSALFVSSQKKKKAEEEAKRKADEEKARREEAEAKVRKMEQEVEERRKKAEAEKEALEKAAKEDFVKPAAPVSAPVKATEPSASVASSPVTKSKTPIFIGIGAVIAVIVIFIVVGSLRGGGGTPDTDYSALSLDVEYIPKAEGFDVSLKYPKSLYTDVTEKKLADDILQLDFVTENKNEVVTNAVITDFIYDDEKVTRDQIVFCSVDKSQKALNETSKALLEKLIPGVNVSEQVASEYSEDNPTTFTCKYKFTSETYKSGAAFAYIAPNSKGEYKVILVSSAHGDEVQESIDKVSDKFASAIPDEAYAMPGANPPTSSEASELIEITNGHIGLHVPKDRFVKWGKAQNYNMFTDLNGAILIIDPRDSDLDFQNNDYEDEAVEALMRDNVDTGLNFYFSDVTSRNIENEDMQIDRVKLNFEYRDTLTNGTYYEYYHLSHWNDLKTGKKYWVTIIVLAPYKDKDIYKQIFEPSISNLLDI